MLDAKSAGSPFDVLYSDFLHKKSLALLYALFSPESAFWKYLAKYESEFIGATLLERTRHVGIVSAYPYSEFEMISRGKASMAKCATAALCILNQTPGKIAPLEESQNHFYTACQILDDLQDWKEDYLNRDFSFILTSVICENKLLGEVESDKPPDLETVGRALYLSRTAEIHIDRALSLLEKAADQCPDYALWVDNIRNIRGKFQKSKDKFHEIRKTLLNRRKVVKKEIGKHVQRKTLRPRVGSAEPHISRALDFILTQRELNFPEMSHKMVFQLPEGFGRKYDYQEGNVFQRALLIDTLLDTASFYPHADEIIRNEVEKLVTAKLRNVAGGWSYFPDLPELPPDADSLGQVLQVLVRSKYDRIDEAVSTPISLLLSECSYDDGSFETWIIDSNDASGTTEVQKRATRQIWQMRMGKDNAVLGNILYGLCLYNYGQLKERIEKAVDCLERRQSADGHWNSTWYWGNYYGTYVALRAIVAVRRDSTTLRKAEKFLVSSQNYDGGWGLIGSDPLNTALALLALSVIKSGAEECIGDGINYLYSKQNMEGHWDRAEFIRMDTSVATLTYKSKTMTTQFCLKALAATSKLEYLKGASAWQKSRQSAPSPPRVHHVYKGYASYPRENESVRKGKGRRLPGASYKNLHKKFFESLSDTLSSDEGTVIESPARFKEDRLSRWTNNIQKSAPRMAAICRESVSRCFDKLPVNEMPDIYLWTGNHTFPVECVIVSGKPAVVLFLEYFGGVHAHGQLEGSTYYDNIGIHEITKSVPVLIASQYARLILKQIGVLRDSFLSKLIESGFASYFSNWVFPEIPLSAHLGISSAELEWCFRNEWFLKREMQPYLQSRDEKKSAGTFLEITGATIIGCPTERVVSSDTG